MDVVSDPARKKSQGVLWGLFNVSCESKKAHEKNLSTKYRYRKNKQSTKQNTPKYKNKWK